MKVSNTMSNSDTPTTATPYPDSYISVGWRYSLEAIHTIACIEDSLRRFEELGSAPVDTLLFSVAETRLERDNWRKDASDDVPAGDQRIEYLWRKLWDALDGDIEQDETWGIFMDAIPGMPDLRTKTYGGVVTLKFYFAGVEVSGGDNDDIESAILEQIADDLQYGQEDEAAEVDYDEE